MCDCGCNTCETKGPLLTEGKVKSLLSEGLQYHIDKKIPLFETVYRIGSDKHLSLIKEARKMYSRNVIDLCEEDEALINTHLGEFALYEGESVPLDLPMLEESNMPSQEEVNKFFSDTQNEMHYLNSKPVAGQKGTLSKSEVEPWDEYDLSNWKSLNRKAELNEDRKYNQEELLRLDLIARRKFDCDYEKCTDEQKDEILKDKVKVGVKEALQEAKKDIYDKFLDNPSSPKGRAKSLILKFIKEYGDDASSMAVDRFASKNNLKPEEKYILKYITKNDIKISSQSGGPDFSAVSEAEMKEDGFPDKFTSDEDIVYLKMKEDSRGAHYNLYYKGYDIEFGGIRFGTVKSLMDYSLQRIVSRQTADKLRFEDAKPLPTLDEAEFKGKEVALGKPKRGGSKAYYVYVKDGDKVKKVTFGSGGLRAKIKNKEARNAFAARHNCKDKKDRTKAGYWSCNLPRYAPALGLGAKMNTFW
jgi:hypothetical protein